MATLFDEEHGLLKGFDESTRLYRYYGMDRTSLSTLCSMKTSKTAYEDHGYYV